MSRRLISWNVASLPGDSSTFCRRVSRVPLSSRRTGLGPGALFLREVPGALWHPSSAHASGWTHAAASPSLCQHHVQFHGHVEVSGLLSPSGAMIGPVAWSTSEGLGHLSLPLTEAALGTLVSSSERMTS